DTYPILLSFTHCGNKSILRVLRIILVILPEHPSETKVFHNEDGNPARANIKQALGSPQRIDEFDLNGETSLSEYDEEEQNVLYFNDLLPFNIIHPDDLKSERDNDDNEIDIIQSLGEAKAHGSKSVSDTSDLNLRISEVPGYLRFEGLRYTDADILDFESRLTMIYKREVHRVQVFNFKGLPDLMAEGLSARMLMEHRDAQGQSVFTSRAWRRLFDIRGPLVHELILEFFSTFRFREAILDLDTPGALQFQLGRARRRLSWRQFIFSLGLHTREEMESSNFARYYAESARQILDKGDLRDY
ncbi:hypothetical protein Tco_0522024, partial [Tanacetum coccineum]